MIIIIHICFIYKEKNMKCITVSSKLNDKIKMLEKLNLDGIEKDMLYRVVKICSAKNVNINDIQCFIR